MDKKEKIKKRILQVINTLDPSGENGKRYETLIDGMSKNKFKDFIQALKDKVVQLHIIMPNMAKNLDMENIHKATKLTNTKLTSRIWRVDNETGQTYLSPNEYFVINIPIKRMQQTVDKKLSVDSNDDRVDNTTGALIKQTSASALSSPEIQCLFAQGLDLTLIELLKLRGGDVNAYDEFKRQLEDTGSISMARMSNTSTTRSVVMTDVLFKSLHIKSNFSDEIVGVENE